MKRNVKIAVYLLGAIILLTACIIGGLHLKNYLYEKMNPPFENTIIIPDSKSESIEDTMLVFNDIKIKMIGIPGGKICCEGLRDTITLHNFYIAETEVTQELWRKVMGGNPSNHRDSLDLPVENVDLVECLKFVNILDSISGLNFYIPSYPHWLYAANLGNKDIVSPYCGSMCLDEVAWYKGNSNNSTHPVKQKKPNALGIYDMSGNVSEWTLSGSDPLFYVMGGGFDCGSTCCEMDKYEIDHAEIKTGSIGLRLVYFPSDFKKDSKN